MNILVARGCPKYGGTARACPKYGGRGGLAQVLRGQRGCVKYVAGGRRAYVLEETATWPTNTADSARVRGRTTK